MIFCQALERALQGDLTSSPGIFVAPAALREARQFNQRHCAFLRHEFDTFQFILEGLLPKELQWFTSSN